MNIIMNIIMKRAAVLLLGLCACIGLAGCADPASPKPTPKPTSFTLHATLTVRADGLGESTCTPDPSLDIGSMSSMIISGPGVPGSTHVQDVFLTEPKYTGNDQWCEYDLALPGVKLKKGVYVAALPGGSPTDYTLAQIEDGLQGTVG